MQSLVQWTTDGKLEDARADRDGKDALDGLVVEGAPRTTVTLARRGLSLLAAKRAMEELLFLRRVFVSLPMVEDKPALTAELAGCGIAAAPADPPSATDVRALRACL